MMVGGEVRNQIFLYDLPTYQEVTALLIEEANANSAFTNVRVPSGYPSQLFIDGHALIEHGEDNSITVFYFTRDSSAVGHPGYIYRSDDNPEALKKTHTTMGFKRLAPKWYVWGD